MNTIILNKWSHITLPLQSRSRASVTRDKKVLFIDVYMNHFENKDIRTFREDFTIQQLDQNDMTSYVIQDVPFPPSNFDTFTDGTLLLASARCLRTRDWIQQNVRRYSEESECLDEFVLGDGIWNLAIDDKDRIWVGYFDEGVYGNMGWKKPIGWSGLVAFSSTGEVLFRPELPMIHELLSLNVQHADQVYAHYTLFSSIIHLDHFEEVEHNDIDEKVEIGPIMMIDDALVTYEYGSGSLTVLRKQEGIFRKEQAFLLKDQGGNQLHDQYAVVKMRGNQLFLFNDFGIFQIELTAELLE
ncbi:hypothetical protein [Jeotgalibacillus salarius]|uniref:Uncharacterized protein n=1 Tax=Jeotgalibacillus salarius TaxID=546023 RepID=A0A4Y8LN88_9BACL|nr:hypothetical protein [Jeotgalibacillus salarius]TFE04053.1 hypothetical protein E2626_01620 [Jeotgalibacillus salarius]